MYAHKKFRVSVGLDDGTPPLVIEGELDVGMGERIVASSVTTAHHLVVDRPEVYDQQGNQIMANIQLLNDTVMTLRIVALDAEGTVVPAPAGDTFTVASSNPASLAAALGAMADGGPAVVLTPLVQVSPGLSFTVQDSSGLPLFTDGVDIVGDDGAKTIGVDLTATQITAQPAPTAPGP
jgi:hypothetical protein